MNYLDFNEIDQTSNIPSTNIQTTATSVVNQQAKDLSDWRNIQLGTTPTSFERFWMPTTVNPWTPPIYPSPYNQQTPSTYPWMNSNNNQSWPMTTFQTNTPLPLINFNSPQQNFTHTDMTNDVIDLTTNNTVNPSTPIRFVEYINITFDYLIFIVEILFRFNHIHIFIQHLLFISILIQY